MSFQSAKGFRYR